MNKVNVKCVECNHVQVLEVPPSFKASSGFRCEKCESIFYVLTNQK